MLGKGGMGVVTLARDRELNREVAVKVVLQPTERLEQLMRQEAQTLAGLEHENIVRLYDMGSANGTPYLVMEYVRGRTLSGRLAAGPVSVMEAVRICRDMVAGIRVAHDRGIIHFDIKPGNIFLDEGGRAKVADFGLAQVIAKGAEQSEGGALFYFVGGTPAYMAPEQRYSGAGKPADVYACGVVLCEMLTGRATFPGRSEQEMRQLKTGAPLPRPSLANPRVPAALDELVVASLNPLPDERPTLERFGHVLDDWLERVTRVAHRAGVSEYPAHPYRFLEWFDVQDAPIFFGRDAEAQELTELVARPAVRLITVFGPCGIGKSSILRAGLGRAVDPARHQLFVLIGGPSPARRILELLAARGAAEGVTLPGVPVLTAEALGAEPRLVPQLISAIGRQTRKWLVIVLDQTEEVFTQNPAGASAPGELFALLAQIVEDISLPVKVVVAYRTEFRGDFFPLDQRLAPHLQSFPLAEIDESGLAEAIEGPSLIETYGFSYQVGLPRTLAREIVKSARANRTSALPTLQIICRQLFDRMRETRSKVVTWDLFETSLGGASGALQRYVETRLADPVYAHQGAVARQMLEALTIKDGERERYACARDEEDVLDFPDQRQAMQTLDQLIADRLVVRDIQDGRRMVRLTSEVICPAIDAWNAAPDPAQVAARTLARSYRIWVEAGRGAEGLLTSRQLASVRAHVGALRGISDDERRYIEMSARHVRRLRNAFATLALAVLVLTGGIGWILFLRPGKLELTSEPPGAQVSLGAQVLGITPLTWGQRPGVYDLTLTRADHDPVQLPVRLEAGGSTKLAPFLPYRRGVLEIITDPPGATVALTPLSGPAGGPSSLRTPFTTEVVRGDYALAISLPGWEPRTLPRVTVKGNRQMTHEVVKLSRTVGWLTAGVSREGATLSVTEVSSGRAVAEEPLPLKAPLSLPIGTYETKVTAREGRIDYGSIAVTARTTTALSPWIPALGTLWEVRGFTTVNPPGAADLDGDGRDDLVYASREGNVHAISGRTGAAIWTYRTGGPILMTPCLGDIDQDGVADAVVTSHDFAIHAISGRTGSALWTRKTGAKAQSNPALVDLNADGTPDVVAGSTDGRIYAVNGHDGGVLWTYATGGSVYSDPKAEDLDGDLVPDIVCGSDDHLVHAISGATGQKLWTAQTGGEIGMAALPVHTTKDAVPDFVVASADRMLHAFRGKTGAPLWQARGDAGFDGQPALIGDVDGDGVEDLAVVSADFHRVVGISGATGGALWTRVHSGNLWPLVTAGRADGATEILVASPAEVLVLSGRTGVPRFGIGLGRAMTASPGWADVDGDGALDVVHVLGTSLLPVAGRIGQHRWSFQTSSEMRHRPALGSRATGAAPPAVFAVGDERKVYALDGGTGERRWAHDAGVAVTADPGVADVDRDGVSDVLVGTARGVQAVSGKNGSALWTHTTGSQVETRPAAGDLDGDGVLDVVVGTNGRRVLALSGKGGAVLWEHGCEKEVAADPLLVDLDGDSRLEVVAASLDGRVHALNGGSGKPMWQAALTGAVKCAPATAQVKGVAAVVVGAEDGAVTALDAGTGKPLWTYASAAAVRVAPVFLETRNVSASCVVFGDSGGSVRALRSADGTLAWVHRVGTGGGFSLQTPALADLDGDAVPDVFVAHRGALIVLSGADGHELSATPESFVGYRHPVTFDWNGYCGVVAATTSAIEARRWELAPERKRARPLWDFPTGGAVRASPAAGDLDGDGRVDVVAGSMDGNVYALDAAGARRWSFDAGAPVVAAPLLAPLRGAKPDVVAATTAGKITALGGTRGEVLWTYDAGAPVVATPALGVADGDTIPDVLAAARNGTFHAISGRSGAKLWSRPLAKGFLAAPTALDLDGDSSLDVLLGSEDGQLMAVSARDGRALWTVPLGAKLRLAPGVIPSRGPALPPVLICPAGKTLFAVSGKDGRAVWKYECKADIETAPALGLLDNDPVPDVAIGLRDGTVVVLSGATGTPLWDARAGERTSGRLAIATLEQGAHPVVVAASSDGLVYALDGFNGQRTWAHGLGAPVEFCAPAIADLDGDGVQDVIVGCEDGTLHAFKGLKSLAPR